MTKLTKATKQISKADERPEGLPEVGRLYVNKRNEVITVKKVYFTGPRHKYYKNEWRIVYQNSEYESQSDSSFAEWQEYYEAVELEHSSIEEAEAWALKEFSNPTLHADLAPGPESTALTVPSTKQKLQAAYERADIMRRRADIVQRLMQRKLKQFESIERAMLEQLSTLGKQIRMIELYLGVYEEVVTLRTGLPAPADTPISFRQLVLFMDEEVGDTRRRKNGQYGIDWTSVKDFDAWLMNGDNLARVFPEPKGVVCFQPTRQPRTYSDDALIQTLLSAKNKKIYLLIRNGECLYRVYTDYISRVDKLFPGPDELQNILEQAQKSGRYFEERDAEKLEHAYRNNALILQGLLDRSEVFRPANAEINLFNPESYNGLIKFIYDAEPSLTDGHISWRKWKQETNSRIQRGSRVILAENMNRGERWQADFAKYRILLNTNFAGSRFIPNPGIYTAESHPHGPNKDGSPRFVVLFNPKDTVYSTSWSSWDREEPHERKRRISFEIEPDDYFVINYDGISLADIEYFLNSRIEREHYLDLMPMLYKLRDERRKEIVLEAEFVKLIAGQNGFSESEVWGAVEWWKHKVIWKRPLMKDDAKAWRMIVSKLKRESK